MKGEQKNTFLDLCFLLLYVIDNLLVLLDKRNLTVSMKNVCAGLGVTSSGIPKYFIVFPLM